MLNIAEALMFVKTPDHKGVPAQVIEVIPTTYRNRYGRTVNYNKYKIVACGVEYVADEFQLMEPWRFTYHVKMMESKVQQLKSELDYLTKLGW